MLAHFLNLLWRFPLNLVVILPIQLPLIQITEIGPERQVNKSTCSHHGEGDGVAFDKARPVRGSI
jgi:hypothetical protein